MPEEILNQEPNLDDNLFDDESDVNDSDDLFNDEDTPSEAGETAAEPQAETPEPFLNIRYNKEDLALSREEAIELAQKGKNYDKVLGNYNDLNSKVERLAKMNGMDVASYLNKLDETQQKFEIDKEVRELKKQYPGSDEKLLEELARRSVSERSQQMAMKEDAPAQGDQSLKDIERQAQALEKYYPGVDIAKLDDEVLDYMADGLSMLEAYSLWKGRQAAAQAEEMAKRESILKRNEENRKKSYGSTDTTGSVNVDDFLKGFLDD